MSVVSKFNKIISKLKFLNRPYYTYTPEPGQYLKRETVWSSAEEALGTVLKSGDHVILHGAGATPSTLICAMTNVAKQKNLVDIRLYSMHTEGSAPYAEPDMEEHFRHVSFFMGSNIRLAVTEGRADTMPLFLHKIPDLFYKKIIKPDICLIHVSPPDEHGYCSLGTSVDCMRAAITHSKFIIAQVNPNMPRTFGDAIIHSSHLDYAVEINCPILGSEESVPGEVEQTIGKLIAENLIEDGSTLQMGIGAIPDAVLKQCIGHKDLGIHSEMFADGVVDLFYEGVITNNKKSMHVGRIVGSFLRGAQKLYDFVDNNPALEMLRVDYVNSPFIIAQQTKMVAINSAIEIDLTGQICADSLGARMYSGFGGQVDFIGGSLDSIDGKGKPIIAMGSITRKNRSKITPYLAKGAGVVTTRGHASYIVTEYGIANLFGKTLRQRAYELIQIAHPDHREMLEKAAFKRLKCMPCKI